VAFRLLDRLAKKLVSEVDRLIISEPKIEDADFEGVNPLVWLDGNEAALNRIDAKAGSLLTHISMMVAAATFMISAVDTSYLERVIIGVEIVCYLFIALLSIRCLGFVDVPGPKHNSISRINRDLRIEVRRRSLILNISIRWMFLVTFLFMLSVFGHIFM
jgi:hypothetical protein